MATATDRVALAGETSCVGMMYDGPSDLTSGAGAAVDRAKRRGDRCRSNGRSGPAAGADQDSQAA